MIDNPRREEMIKTVALTALLVLLEGCAAISQTAEPKATATLRPASGSQASGKVIFTQVGPNRVRAVGEVAGHGPGLKGFHIHEKGDCSAPDAMSAGGHFNPTKAAHGSSPTTGHAGDMGNIRFNDSGIAVIDVVLEGLAVSADAPNGIIGRAVIVHMQPDDLKTDPTGNAGQRAACGVIS
jgi:Cu-Zn family superoxide dismutase